MCNPYECSNAVRGEDDWKEGPCGENPGDLKAEIERLKAALTEAEQTREAAQAAAKASD